MILINISRNKESTQQSAPSTSPSSITRSRLLRYRERTQKLLKNYVDNLTVHGATNIFSGSIIQRIFWGVTLTGVFIYFLILARDLFMQYTSNSSITNTQIIKLKKIKLPSVTVCDRLIFACGLSWYKNNSVLGWCKNKNLSKIVETFYKKVYYVKLTRTGWIPTKDNIEISDSHPGCLVINPKQNLTQDSPWRNERTSFHLYNMKSVSLFIHGAKEVPSWTDRFTNRIQNSGKYNVVLTRRDVKRLPAPYQGNCSTPVISSLLNFPHSETLCQQYQTAMYILKKCGTVGDNLWKYLPSSLRNIESSNNTEKNRDCVKSFMFQEFQKYECAKP